MAVRAHTIVIGAGPAGLSASYHLSQRGIEHLVLERGRVGETWRTQRWDGFFLNTPNWTLRLPGREYAGDEPDAFPPLAEVIAYLEGYAAVAPVRTAVEVTRLRQRDGGWTAEAGGDAYEARNVIVATGAYQQPFISAVTRDVPKAVFQVHTSGYTHPDQLPPGAVLVVGSGQSGCQIADELLQAGRRVFLSAGRCPWFPRRYRGREIMHWLIEIGLMDQTVDKLPDPSVRLACNPPVSGNDGGHDCHPTWLAARGATLVGRLTGFRDGTATFADGLGENLVMATEFVATITRRVDEYVAAAGADVPPEELDLGPAVPDAPLELDLRGDGITTILWATGFRPNLGWIEVPLDQHGWPVHERGVTTQPGLYFVGLHWLHKRKSSLFLGVGEDADYVVSRLAAGDATRATA